MKIPEQYKTPDDLDLYREYAIQIQMERWVEDLELEAHSLRSKLDQINHISKY